MNNKFNFLIKSLNKLNYFQNNLIVNKNDNTEQGDDHKILNRQVQNRLGQLYTIIIK